MVQKSIHQGTSKNESFLFPTSMSVLDNFTLKGLSFSLVFYWTGFIKSCWFIKKGKNRISVVSSGFCFKELTATLSALFMASYFCTFAKSSCTLLWHEKGLWSLKTWAANRSSNPALSEQIPSKSFLSIMQMLKSIISSLERRNFPFKVNKIEITFSIHFLFEIEVLVSVRLIKSFGTSKK